MNHPKWILPVIVISQFCCTSLWFAGNAVIGDLTANFRLAESESALSHLISAVQFGFISGTLSFAFLAIADRFSPSRVFFVSAILGALFNLGMVLEGNNFTSLMILRFLTGFFLAGIYPVGMKIASDYYDKGLGKSLGFLVGALVLGKALPYFLKGFTVALSWQQVIISTSILALLGGALVLMLIPDGPYRKMSQRLDLTAFLKVFKNKEFRSAAFGYFGHMWELYAFWVFVPFMLTTYLQRRPEMTFNIPIWSFIIIGLGGLACVLGGYISQYLGAKRTAFIALFLSGLCCLLSPFIFNINSNLVFIGFLIFWGLVVVADSPLFSSLVAKNALPETRGTALTIVNCIGFAITIISIQLLNFLIDFINPEYLYVILAVGPILGLLSLYQSRNSVEII